MKNEFMMMAEQCQLSAEYLNYVSPSPQGNSLWKRGQNKKIYDLSVIVACYNTEIYIRKCLESVINQMKDHRIELIVVDDGSCDGTLGILHEYERIDDVTIFSKANGGTASARNTGLDIAKGKYIFFLDADDYLIPNALVRVLDKTIAEDLDVVQAGMSRFITDDDLVEVENHISWNTFSCGKFFRSDYFDEVCFPEGYWFEDDIIYFQILPRCERKLLFPEVLYAYRQHQNSTGSEKNGSLPKSIDAYWMLELNIQSMQKLGIEWTQDLYEHFLYAVSLVNSRTSGADLNSKTAIFYLIIRLYSFIEPRFSTRDRFQSVLEKGLMAQDYPTYRDGAALFWNHTLLELRK